MVASTGLSWEWMIMGAKVGAMGQWQQQVMFQQVYRTLKCCSGTSPQTIRGRLHRLLPMIRLFGMECRWRWRWEKWWGSFRFFGWPWFSWGTEWSFFQLEVCPRKGAPKEEVRKKDAPNGVTAVLMADKYLAFMPFDVTEEQRQATIAKFPKWTRMSTWLLCLVCPTIPFQWISLSAATYSISSVPSLFQRWVRTL